MKHMENQTLKIVKIGGKLIEDQKKFREFLKDFAALNGPKILVHGGGKMATEVADKLGVKTQMFEGRRITDADSIKVITMVYAGLINKNIVADLQGLGANAVGLTGADGMSVISRQRPVKEVDYGLVGDVEQVNAAFIESLLKQGLIPVFSAITCTTEGQLLNTNADSIAAAIATEMSAQADTRLYFCFEKKGVLADAGDDASVIPEINRLRYRELLEEGVISDGMLPKLHNCFQALEQGVEEIYLGDYRLLQNETMRTKIIE